MDERLITLLAITDEGGFAKAARALNLSQPAVSYQMRQLEQLYGLRLFMRVGNQMLLTEEGKVLTRYARAMLAARSRLQRQLEEARAGLRPMGLVFAEGEDRL